MDSQVWLTILAAVGGGSVGSAITAVVSRRNSREAAEDARAKNRQDLLLIAIEMADPETHTEWQVAIGTALITAIADMHKLSADNALLVQSVTAAITKEAREAGRKIVEQGDDPDYVIEEDE